MVQPGVVADGSRLHFGLAVTRTGTEQRRGGPASAPAAGRYVFLACVGDGTVYRIDDMTSTIAEFRLPGRMLEVEGRNGERRSEYDYIGPALAPNGDVYAIKEPGNTFEIVRWRWEEDPSVPTDLVATPAAERVVLSWKVPRVDGDEITGYEIFRASRRCGTYSHVGTVPKDKTEFQDTQLPSSTSLFYKVRAVSGNRQSAFSTCAMMQR